ncbi:hypothetical protein Hanom_Chr16g01496401 [Helianthus anomalus]
MILMMLYLYSTMRVNNAYRVKTSHQFGILGPYLRTINYSIIPLSICLVIK